MVPSLQALLTGAIDYAGLFPPAKLPLEAAWDQYHRYRAEPERWMLGSFVIPALQLKDLVKVAQPLDSNNALVVSLLGPEIRTGQDLADQAARPLLEPDCWRQFHKKEIIAKSYEIKVSTSVSSGPEASLNRERLLRILKSAHELMGQGGRFFIEWVDANAVWPKHASIFPWPMEAHGTGLKIRCGGVTADQTPSVERLAELIRNCGSSVPLKFTAGLHHPLRHFYAELKAKRHGFINVLTAAAFAGHADEETIAAILAEEDAKHFQFTSDGIRFREHFLTMSDLSQYQDRGGTSFGSCSFEEPRNDLRALGWLP